MKILNAVAIILMIGLAACSTAANEPAGSVVEEVTAAENPAAESAGGMGMGSGMMARHHALIPGEYAGLTNPVSADDDSLARGAETFAAQCATCHGDGGMGDGPAAVGLDPAPAAVAHTSQMIGDDYLFYRISEGGDFDPFNSVMPSWKDVLDEQARWDVINYIRALGSGQVMPEQRMGGMSFDPEAEAIKHEKMASEGVEQGVITQEEADTFLAVHAELDALVTDSVARMGVLDDVQATMLAQLIEDGRISPKQAETFSKVHDALVAAGLME